MVNVEDLRSENADFSDGDANKGSAETRSEEATASFKTTQKLIKSRGLGQKFTTNPLTSSSNNPSNLSLTSPVNMNEQEPAGEAQAEKPLHPPQANPVSNSQTDGQTPSNPNSNLEGTMFNHSNEAIIPNATKLPGLKPTNPAITSSDQITASFKGTAPTPSSNGVYTPRSAVTPERGWQAELRQPQLNEADRERLDYEFHRLIQQLEFTPSLETPLVIGVTSTLRGEGRTTVALGLASALAQEIPLPVVLVEADLEKPSLAADLGLPNRGLGDYLMGYLELDDLAQSTPLSDLRVIVAGDSHVTALKALRSERLGSLIKLLSQQAAAVVVDLPPMSSTGEAARVISLLDRVLMVVEAGATPAKLVKSAIELIPQEKIGGVLLNRTKPAFGFFHRLKK